MGTSINYKSITLKAKALVIHVGNILIEERSKLNSSMIESKGENDFVTHCDKLAEKYLVDGLRKIFPESGFITEENTDNTKGEIYDWIIDPIDGTTNFIHGVAPYSISVALRENDELVIGIVYSVVHDECFFSWKGGEVYLNEETVNCSNTLVVKDSLIATGFPYCDFNRLHPFMKTLIHFMENSHGIRRLGSAAVDLAYVACGRYDAFYEYNLKPYDVAAGAFLVQQAGGKVTDFAGGNNWLMGKEIVASNEFVFDEFQGIINRIMLACNDSPVVI